MKMFLVLQTFLDYIVNILEQFGFISRGGLQGGKLGTGESCTGEARLVKEVSRSVFFTFFSWNFHVTERQIVGFHTQSFCSMIRSHFDVALVYTLFSMLHHTSSPKSHQA